MEQTKREAGLDAVRGVAITLVLLFHFYPETFPLGYLGVDLFFALSGYFIARQLLIEKRSLGSYLRRRIWRLVPPVMILLGVCLLAGIILMTPGELIGLSLDTLSGSFFLSNWFGPEGGYFDPVAEKNPLLHLWSLGVEMQVYVFAALAAFIMGRGRVAMIGFALVASASFVGWMWAEDAFYETHWRFWQFGLGAALAWLPMVTAASFLWLGAGVVTLTVLPESASARGLIFFAVGGYLVVRGDTGFWMRPLVWLGQRSYGIYLWHWPALVFAGLILPDGLSAQEKIAAVAASLVLAELSWRLIETRKAAGFWAWVGTGQGALVVLSVAVITAFGVGLPQRLSPTSQSLLLSSEYSSSDGKLCNHLVENRRGTIEHCQRGEADAPRRIAIMGDSHAAMLAPALARAGTLVDDFAVSGCPLSLEVYAEDEGYGCAAENRRALAIILGTDEIEEVVLHGRWSRYTEDRFSHPDGARDHNIRPTLVGNDTPEETYKEGLGILVKELRNAGKRVTLVTQSPVFGFNPRGEAIRAMLWQRSWSGRKEIDRSILDARFADMRDVLAELPVDRTVDPMEIFCDAQRCHAASEGRDEIWFADQDHLSRQGADLLAAEVLRDRP